MQNSSNARGHLNRTGKNLSNVPSNEWMRIVVCISVFLSLSAALRLVARSEENPFILFGVSFSIYVFSGILAQIQLLTVVYMAIRMTRKGYIVAVSLNAFGIAFAVFGMIQGGTKNPIPGMITYLGSIVIATVINNYRKKLQYLAFYDSLTGLPNRKMITEELDAQILSASKGKSRFTFVFIDLDNFKEVNDMMGHHIGDRILQMVVVRWKPKIHREDLLGRLGGDEFALIIRRELGRDEILEYVGKLQNALTEAISFDGKTFYLNASFGISSYPQDGDNTTDLLKLADIAMYSVKNSGKNGIMFFCQTMQDDMLQKIRLEKELKGALKNKELYMVFQPQYFCGSHEVRGFESLVRWRSAELGSISPAEFIPVAERTGLIIEIGEWILRTVLKKFKDLQECGHTGRILTVNISVIQIIQPNFAEMVEGVLRETGYDSRLLEMEITESVFISYPEKVVYTLNRLKALGIRIALDDYGAGYTSLKYLQILPIDTLKIDKSVVDNICDTQTNNHIVSSLISLAHKMGIAVVAEGVENKSQLNYLKKHNCDIIQGYLLSRPLEEEQLSGMEIPKTALEA